MTTQVLRLDPDRPDPAGLRRAAAVLAAGGLVAFPTETVYGLGGNALDPAAVTRIFAAKGRPAHNPVIVHTGTAVEARALATDWPDAAQRLAERFWPGPLTLVVGRRAVVPAEVTAGGPTVALRVPAHPVALALLQLCRVPVAAPSANRSGKLSATRAAHVLADLDGLVDVILDAGPAPGGLESTVVDVSCSPPRLLRPGLVGPAELEALIGPLARSEPTGGSAPLPSPGLLARHYAPRTPLECAPGDGRERVEALLAQGLRVGWITFAAGPPAAGVHRVVLPDEPRACAARLYDVLHELDGAGLDRLVVQHPPAGEEWLAIQDRLRRASAGA